MTAPGLRLLALRQFIEDVGGLRPEALLLSGRLQLGEVPFKRAGGGGEFWCDRQASIRIEGTRIKHPMKPVSLKHYDKFGLILPIETTVNDLTFFKHYRDGRVEVPVTRHLAHRSHRAAFPQWALVEGQTRLGGMVWTW
jgi:hypothetical protein